MTDESPKDQRFRTIKLPSGDWRYNPERTIGSPGGFATVFEGYGIDGSAVAVKRFASDKIQYSKREIEIARELTSASLKHVMRVLDAGADAISLKNYMVMPRAERSLADYLARKFRLGELETVEILLQLLDGLDEVPALVHRDLKPSNILFCDGVWKISDFGIARFIEDVTSSQTVGWAFSPHYAAPELWLGERATRESDLYAAGCIGYELASGRKAFEASTRDDCRERHLGEVEPPRFESWTDNFWLAIRLCLRKRQGSRPDTNRLRELLSNGHKSPESSRRSTVAEKLKSIAEQIAADSSAGDAAAFAHERTARRRLEVAQAGYGVLRPILRRLLKTVEEANLNRHLNGPLLDNELRWSRRLGRADLTIHFLNLDLACFENQFAWAPFDAVCGAFLIVSPAARETWGASLWYADFARTGTYRWHEVAYQSTRWAPYEVNTAESRLPRQLRSEEVNATFLPLAHNAEAYPPRPIDDENADDFVDRWLILMGLAAQGKLEPPPSVPMGDWWPSLDYAVVEELPTRVVDPRFPEN